MDFSGTQLKKWLIDLSNKPLSNDETPVLAKWFNFAVALDKQSTNELIVATQLVCKMVARREKEVLRSKLVNAL